MTNALYLDHQKILGSLTSRFLSLYGGDREEVSSEADFLFLQAAETYDPHKGAAFPTWVHWKVWSGLRNHHRAEMRQKERERIAGEARKAAQEAVDDFPDRLEGLSREALQVAFLALQEAGETLSEKPTKGEIQEALRAAGWKWKDIWGAFSELREALS